ncbi:ATP-binding protein [Pontibacillus sp. HMF3514]|uniref:ATP-binding protein n=1 Tax=Pontibacillus sp. HMF3514 TaxID=2692425 RepID=UPI00131F5138|nr:ATP-binding protein [Pontibacillus sp. HMF3514]QHE54078.1 histidine kinase [Pontibacillus sp. HMF3514]
MKLFQRKVYTAGLTGLILLMALYLVYVTMTQTYIGINLNQNQEGQWEVSAVDPIGWAGHHNIQRGEVLVEVNRKQPDEHRSIRRYGVIGDIEQLKTRKKGVESEYTTFPPTNSDTLLYHTIIPSIVFVILFALSSFIYARKKEDRTALILSLFFLNVGLGYLSAGASARADIIARFIAGLSFMMTPTLFLHFLVTYFLRYRIYFIRLRTLIILYGVNLLIVLIDTFSFFFNIGGLYSIIRNAQLILFSFEIFWCLAVLVIYYFKYRKTIHKPVFQNMIFGIVVSFFPFIFLTALPSSFFGVDIIPPPVSAVFIIFLPIFFLYLVLTNRLFDIDFINSRLRYYSFISVLLTVLIIGPLTLVVTDITIVGWIRLTLSIYAACILFFYLEERFGFKPRFMSKKHNFQDRLDQFTKDISNILKREDLDSRLIKEVKEVLPVASVSLVQFHKADASFKLIEGDKGFPEHGFRYQYKENNDVNEAGDIVRLARGKCFIISERHESLHILWVDNKLNHTPFNQDEISWLKTMAHYTGIVYQNFQLIEGVTEELKQSMYQNNEAPSWLLRLLFNLSEKERARLAYDLHDSALQEQLVWYRKVEELLEEEKLSPPTERTLSQVKEGLLDVVQQIRDTCTFLRPPFLKETGIVQALQHLMDYYRLHANFFITFEGSQFTKQLDHEHSLAIYRIVQELLNNALKHSKAQLVQFDLKSEGDMVVLNYKDDGVGLPPQELSNNSQSMGLAGIRQRVRSLQGDVEFFSSSEGGFELAMFLEIKNQNPYKTLK